MSGCKSHKSYAEHVSKNLKELQLDKNLLLKLLEVIQYTLFYTIVFIYVGTFIDSFFIIKDLKTISTQKLFAILCLHIIVDIICIYVIRKLIKIIPFIGEFVKGYEAHCNVFEIEGEITIGLIFISTQRNLSNSVSELYDRII